MIRLLFLLVLLPSFLMAQSTGNVRNSYWNGTQWVTGSWTGSGAAGVNSTGAPTTYTVSATGGTNTLLITNNSGNVITGAYSNSGAGIGSGPGNVSIPQNQYLGWMSPVDGSIWAGFYGDYYHSGASEVIASSPRWALYWAKEVQVGSAGSARVGERSIYLRALSATVGDQLMETPAIQFRSNTWTGGVSTANNYTVQGIPLDVSGTNAVVRWWANSSMTGTGTVLGDRVMDFATIGINMYDHKNITLSGTGQMLGSGTGTAVRPAYGINGSPGLGWSGSGGSFIATSGSYAFMEGTSSINRFYVPLAAQIGTSNGLILGADTGLATLTANNNKTSALVYPIYASASVVANGIVYVSTSGSSAMRIGGGSGNGNRPLDAVEVYTGTVGSAGTGVLALNVGTSTGVTIPVTANLNGNFRAAALVSSGSITLTGTHSMNQVFSGGSATAWTLPSNATANGAIFMIKNRGSNTLTINSAAASGLYDTAAVSSINIAPGEARLLVNDGTYFNVE